MSQQQPVDIDPTRIVPEGFVFPGTEVLDPREIFAGPGYQAPRQRTDPVATISLILTVLAPVPFLGALAALSGPGVAGRHRRLRDDRRVAVDVVDHLVYGLTCAVHGLTHDAAS